MIEAPLRDRTKPRTTEKPAVVVRTLSGQRSGGGGGGGVYARFLELAPAVVMALLWLMGVVLLAVCGLALYLGVTALA
ncbi:MAG: hypothetical protein M3305_17870 [Actinomycetota bacterium]|nr:hypothetical protein [Actinomycetota bacterium]